MPNDPTTTEAAAATPAETPADQTPDVDETLVEEVSIDGMCGVY